MSHQMCQMMNREMKSSYNSERTNFQPMLSRCCYGLLVLSSESENTAFGYPDVQKFTHCIRSFEITEDGSRTWNYEEMWGCFVEAREVPSYF